LKLQSPQRHPLQTSGTDAGATNSLSTLNTGQRRQG
jgi:hypothetical protein